ncbi:uncharacterized protein LOC111356142 isoform X2 [Spodoptera litura]|uniref:Uncharacterized protein LOC111356142 isoform X2 n=1 Tax=Spodoptera litura TaxID=69820 RepID=A0A9J7E851_SPOLT|nr:uncharacterized protein LOC111356142 isoform X2 [Spodoptera litura]
MDNVVNCIFLFVLFSSVTTTSIAEETTMTTERTVAEKRLVQELNDTDILPMNMNMSAGKPALRHHVAHFCPNLDVARVCIRKCMTYGAPAFCGKDHICYCGHRYEDFDNSNEINTTIDPDENPYKDLYERYFGIKTTSTTTQTPASTTTTTTTTTTPSTTTEDMRALDIMDWIPTNIKNASAHKHCAIIAGYKGVDGIPQMVIRASINKALVPGKLPENDKAAYIGWDRKQHKVFDFEICCVRNKEEIIWKTVESGIIPEKAVVAGYTADGVDLYIGRTAVLGELTSGAVHSVYKAIHVASNGKEVINDRFDVLVRNL